MKISLKKVPLVFLAALICLAPNSSHFPRAAAQQPSSSATIPGLHARATIRRDERGIPYIEAANDDDLYFAQGYVTASDRLWQMDVQRRGARGGVSGVFCPATLGPDKRRPACRFPQAVD